MADFTMTLGNFEALPEKGTDNFATGIYDVGHDGLQIARCNQNGRYPEHARAILEGLNGKKTGLDEITRLRAALERIDSLSKFSMHDAWQNCEDMRAIARAALNHSHAQNLGEQSVYALTAKLGIAMGRNEMLAKALQASVDIMKSYRYMGYGDEVYMDTLCQAIRGGERALDLHRENPTPAPRAD